MTAPPAQPAQAAALGKGGHRTSARSSRRLGPLAQAAGASMAAMVVTGLVAVGCGHLRPFRFEPEQPTPAASPGGKLGDRPLADLFGWVDEHAYVVRVLAADVVCSGTLIEHDRVLTAHHCVAARGADGKPSGGNVAPDKILVELGGDYLPWGEVGVRHVIAPPCGVAAGKGDVAVLVLERPLAGAASLSPELTRPPQIGEKVTPLGFGRCALSKDGIRRHQRAGGPIERLESGRFQLSAAICPGDSGGPVVSDSGELLGVISASVMDSHEETRGASEFIRVDRWRAVFSNAKLIAEGTNPSEIPPIDCFDP